ncbi:faciogenital dysplasia protein [Anaeramoeba ignava]|uniref:Faciogenital dysplasia protein n=1 Tax=Anaeramoeba ignava TaxID=1746090 RepID=A0A9Q0LJZ7_ANAIG|nr:faciogenital dysplasia protein [Anaeramoeba ignava]
MNPNLQRKNYLSNSQNISQKNPQKFTSRNLSQNNQTRLSNPITQDNKQISSFQNQKYEQKSNSQNDQNIQSTKNLNLNPNLNMDINQDENKTQITFILILENEKKYEKKFEELINFWKVHLLSILEKKEELEKIFALANRFITQSKQFSEKLNQTLNIQKQTKPETILDCFVLINQDIYRQWNKQIIIVNNAITEFERHNESFRSTLIKCTHDCGGQDFFQILIIPFFHIREITENLKQISSFNESNNSIQSKLSKTFDLINKIIDETNSTFLIFQKRTQLLHIQKQLGNSSIYLFEATRLLENQGNFKRVSRTKNYQGQYFMFSDMVLLTKQKGKSHQLSYDICIFYSKSKIRNLLDDKKGQIQNAVEFLVEDNPERFICCFESEKIKTEFWNKITSKLGIGVEETNKTAQTTEEIIKKRKELLINNNPAQQPKTILQSEDLQGKTTNMTVRSNVIHELVQTEEKYVMDLNIIIEFYLNPLKKNGIVPKNDISIMFSSIETIFGVNSNILKELKQEFPKDPEKVSELNVGKIFQKYVDFLKIYTQYCSNHSQSMSIVAKYSKKENFENFIQHQKENVKECGGLGILDFLIKPIQRICKYPLLFKELLKGTHSSYPDYQDLFKAYQALYNVAEYVNERQRSAEQSMVVVEILTRLAGIPKSFELVQPTRQFIQEATLKKKSVRRIQERQFWLFSDVIVYGKLSWTSKKKKYQYKGHLYLAEAFVREISSEEFAFQIFPSGSKKGYTIYCDNEEQKKDWENKIKEQIKKLAELGIRPKYK